MDSNRKPDSVCYRNDFADTYADTHGERKPVADTYPSYANANDIPHSAGTQSVRARARDGHFNGPLLRVAVFDAGHRLVLNGHATDSLTHAVSNLADGLTIRYGDPDVGYADPYPAAWGRKLLPVPAEPDPQPDAVAHTHRHAHHARLDDFIARTGIVIDRYDHAHHHAHPTGGGQRVPDDRQYHDDHAH